MIRFVYEGLRGNDRTVYLYDPNLIESDIFGLCFDAPYGELTASGSIAQIAEPGLFPLKLASEIEFVEQLELAA